MFTQPSGTRRARARQPHVRGAVIAAIGATLAGSACASGELAQGDPGGPPSRQTTVVIGSTNFPEQLILANMYAKVLSDRGVKVQKRLNLGNREVVFPALKSGELSVVPEYTGALLSHRTKGEASVSRPEAVLDRLRSELPEGISALQPAPAQNKDALVVTRETAREHDLQAVSDLEGIAGDLVVGGPPEMETRAVGLPGYREVYGLEFEQFRSLDAGGTLTKSALEQGDIDVARLFTTDASIAANDWVVLDDDKGLVPAQNLIPVAREEVLTPAVEKALNELSARITTEEITALNDRVIVDKEDPARVAGQWLREKELIRSG